jgi:ATP-dependent protease HslVU (ClpYQ) peptidase subunit
VTCIVAYADGKRVWMGGDSAGVSWHQLSVRADEKVFRNGAYLMGFTSSFRMGQLLRYRFTPPKHHPDDDLTHFMSTEFVDEVRKCLKTYGYATVRENEETGGCFLVGIEGQIFKIEADYQVAKPMLPFDACGCGEELALGALFAMATKGGKLKPEEVVEAALTAAEAFSGWVRRPWTILSTELPQ